MTEKQTNEESHRLYEFEILKQRYESLEKTLSNVEKEKEYYQVNSSFLNVLKKKLIVCFCFKRKFMNKQKKISNILKRNI
jgi:hypothetical protein